MRLDYQLIPQNSPKFEELQAFAKSFDHDAPINSGINYYGIYKAGKLIAFSAHVFLPTVYPAFHPDFCGAREVIQVCSDFRANMQIQGQVGFIGTPVKADRIAFTDEVMEKLGFDLATKREIFTLPTSL